MALRRFHFLNPNKLILLKADQGIDLEILAWLLGPALPNDSSKIHSCFSWESGWNWWPWIRKEVFFATAICFHLTHWDSKARFLFTIELSWEMRCLLDWDGFGMIWVCVLPCPCQNVHRDIIPCNSLLGQKSVEKSCWLESWILCMAFHNAVWLISMVKIQELFPSYTGTTKATTWQTEWAVMAVNYVQSHWSCWIISPNLRTLCRGLQRTLLGQLAMRISDATTRLCEFWTSGNFNSASIWLIGIRRQVFLQLLSEMRSIYIITSA